MKTRILALAIGALTLSGCVSVFPDPPEPPRIFPLRPADTVAAAPARADVSLIVAAPLTPRALSGSDLVVAQADGSLAYVAGAQWAGSTSETLRGLLVETFDRAGLVRAVAPDTAGARGDYVLRVEVAAFDLTAGRREAGRARFAAAARLIDARTRAAVASTRVETTAPAPRAGPVGAAEGLTAAAREGALAIASWAATAAQDARAASSSR